MARILLICHGCGINLDAGAEICDNCGAKQDEHPEGWIKATLSDSDGDRLSLAGGLVIDYKPE